MGDVSFRLVAQCRKCRVNVAAKVTDERVEEVWCPSCDVKVSGDRYRQLQKAYGQYLALRVADEMVDEAVRKPFREMARASPMMTYHEGNREHRLEPQGDLIFVEEEVDCN